MYRTGVCLENSEVEDSSFQHVCILRRSYQQFLEINKIDIKLNFVFE